MNPDYIQLNSSEELRTLHEYANKKEKEMDELSREYSNMSIWSLRRDYIGPKYKFWFFPSFEASDNHAILEKVDHYQKFYFEVCYIAREITDSEGVSYEQLLRKIFQLKERLSQVYVSAKREEYATWSNAIRCMHRSFIQEYEVLHCFVKDFQNAALFEMLKAAQNGCRRDCDETADISVHLRDIIDRYNDICKIFERHAKDAETLRAHNDQLNEKVDEVMGILRRFIP